jgi:NAD(P)-dependent dehydrogenase (short-subunit alcohol dehydrogenase family)
VLPVFDLNGQFVLITGSAGLLGQKHAEAILEAGGTPILTDVFEGRLRDLAGVFADRFERVVPWYVMDVTDEASIRNIRNQTLEKGQVVSVLINNAARNPTVSSEGLQNGTRLESFDPLSFIDDVKVGLVGAVLCAKVFGTDMAEKRRGSIINIASDLGVIAPDQRLYHKEGRPDNEQDVKPVGYSLVKHGVVGFTKYLATYWGHLGVRSNCISPGGVFNGQGAEFVQRISRLIPLGRMAHADEYKGAIVFLASDASSYMNGANLVMDGGRSVW